MDETLYLRTSAEAARAAGDEETADLYTRLVDEFEAEKTTISGPVLRKTMSNMLATGYPPFVNAVNDFFARTPMRNGTAYVENAGPLMIVQQLRLVMKDDPVQLNDSSIFNIGINTSPEGRVAIIIAFQNKQAVANPKWGEDYLDPMMEFYGAMYLVSQYIAIAREVGNNGGSTEDAVNAMKEKRDGLMSRLLADERNIYQSLVINNQISQWGLKVSVDEGGSP
jgi:hypothetical protein